MKIAVLGPESSGKTSLCQALAKYFSSQFIPEYSREYLRELNGQYNFDDLKAIAKGQFVRNNNPGDPSMIICDTECITVKVWSLVKYEKYSPEVEDLICRQDINLYLLCAPDLAWEYDPLRESSDIETRQRIFDLFKEELEVHGFNYSIVKGKEKNRIKNALQFIFRSDNS